MASSVSDVHTVAPRPPRLRRIARSFGYAFEGLVAMLRTQPNFGVHLIAACVALGLGFALRLSLAELAVLLLTIALVLVVECLNTALETLCDLVSPGYHPLVKRAKDVSAAAVLIAAFGAALTGVALFGPRLLGLLK